MASLPALKVVEDDQHVVVHHRGIFGVPERGRAPDRRALLVRLSSDRIHVRQNDVNLNPLRNLSSVERVLRAGPGAPAVSRFARKLATDAVRHVPARVRPALTAGEHNVPIRMDCASGITFQWRRYRFLK
jgi:hypothetical protein